MSILEEPGTEEPVAEPIAKPVMEPKTESKTEAKVEVKKEEHKDSFEDKYENSKKALREARELHRAELESARKRFGDFDTLKQQLDAYRKEKQTQTEAEQYQADPANFLLKKITDVDAKLGTAQEQFTQQQEAQRQTQMIVSAVQQHETKFLTEAPDYYDAL